MRRLLYLSLIERLKTLTDDNGQPVIKTFDLWNEQVEFIEQEEIFAMPAVFIEMQPLKWATLGGDSQQADATVRLHILTPWDGSSRDGSQFQEQTLARFDLLDRIDRCLFNLTADDGQAQIYMFRRSGTATNHNHGEVVEDISDHSFRVTQRIKRG
ncbi:MAG: hypothetical protein LBN29_01290 [Mediterranea sp.]|jgi:hypothetical protein|nr:hypothetical protein [Mediterranea sp.]